MISKLAALAASTVWAIDSEWASRILAIANREGAGPEAVAAQLGRTLDNTRSVSVRDGVAIVPVVGPVFRRASMFTEVSGATSLDLLARDFHAAIANPDVTAVILDIDSPGGEANGVNEFAEHVYAARGTKPIVAYVGGMAASAAYWIASACDEIVADATAEVGSIGTVIGVPAPDATSAKQIEIVSSQSPNKRPNIASEGGRAQYQRRVDEHAAIFIAKVARNRRMDASAVVTRFQAGGLLMGAAAVKVGAIDSLGSLEETIARLARRSGPSSMLTASTTRPRTVPTAAAIEVPRALSQLGMSDSYAETIAGGESAEQAQDRINAKIAATAKRRDAGGLW